MARSKKIKRKMRKIKKIKSKKGGSGNNESKLIQELIDLKKKLSQIAKEIPQIKKKCEKQLEKMHNPNYLEIVANTNSPKNAGYIKNNNFRRDNGYLDIGNGSNTSSARSSSNLKI